MSDDKKHAEPPKFHATHKAHAKHHVARPEMKSSNLPLSRRVLYGLYAAIWVAGMFVAAQLIILLCALLVRELNISLPLTLNDTVLQTTVSALVYMIAIVLAVGVPWLVLKQKLNWSDLGFAQPLPSWRDIGLAPLAFIISSVATVVVMALVGVILPGVDMDAKQAIGFENLTERYEMLLAFFTLVVLAPVCEEILFRGYFYGRVRRYYNAFWAIALTSVVFGLMHLYAGPGLPLQWNVFIGTAVLAIFIGLLREYTGSIWAGILLHMIKNGIAFFVLFVAPLLGISLVQ